MDSFALSKFESFERTGDLQNLHEAIWNLKEMVERTPPSHPNHGGLMNNLSFMLETRFDRLRTVHNLDDLRDLDDAINMAERAVQGTPADHPNFTIYLSSAGSKLRRRFECTQQLPDLQRAVRMAEGAVQATPSHSTNYAICLSNLANMLQYLFEGTGEVEYLQSAIVEAERAVAQVYVGHPYMAGSMRDLSVKLVLRYKALDNEEDLARAIYVAEQALDAIPEGHPDRIKMQHNLANMYENRFNLTGVATEENMSIDAAEAAVLAAPQNDPQLPTHLKSLGHNLWRRYERTGRMEDLEEAVRRLQQAVELTPHASPALPSRLNSLATVLFTRYQRTGDIQDSQGDLGRAILAVQDAIEMARARPADQDLDMFRTNLSVLLINRYNQGSDIRDLNEAIENGEEAVRDRNPSHYNNQGINLERRFQLTGNSEDLDRAIQYAQDSVRLTPENHRDLSGRLNNLGHRLCLTSPPRWEQALECFTASWNCGRGVPFHRVDAARQAIRLLKKQDRWREAATISKQATDLLCTVNDRSLNREDQQVVASKFAGFVSDACSLSLQIGDDAANALEILENGRGSIMGLLINDRSDISELEAAHPQLAGAYSDLRTEVKRSTEMNGGLTTTRRRVGDHIDIVGKLFTCIDNIRKLPGFERFLLGQTSEQLMSLAGEGPIAVINITDLRSDAFILTPSEISSTRLPDITPATAMQWVNLLHKSATLQEKIKDARRFLKHLWSACVKIVLDKLQLQPSSAGQPRTRIWWIGAGNACSLPFHAAGDHSGKSTDNTASWVVSSYIPTLKALAYAREKSPSHSRQGLEDKPGQLLVVAMPKTPGLPDLPNTATEMDVIRQVTQGAMSNVGLTMPNAQTVLSELKQSEIAHFACHGESQDVYPLNSYLALYDDSDPRPRVDRLTVQQISEASLKNVWIAYLSACKTAQNKAQQLNDEAIHLASGFQVAGFSHVIASLWEANDETCVKVARHFYEGLVAEKGVQRHDGAVALALHNSVEKIRSNRFANSPLLWAPFIHVGA